ncbi:phosphotransferase [Actinopolymorpha sp. B17G11]|uniref:phosphotransferase enzyme family protein n=1 Tax=Actinopolymorpha sp. B17G11 TaxID=3160861 RepID=UPI0032E39C97
MDEYAALEAWKSVVGAARVEPMDEVHNPIWKVTGEDGRQWVLKHLPQMSPGVGPVEEYRVLCYLQAGGLPVAVPVVTDDGLIVHNADHLGTDPNQTQPTGADAYALIPLLRNDPELHESPALAHTIGAGIGRLDQMLAECPWHVTSFSDDPAPDILGDGYAKLPVELRTLVDPLRDQLWAALADLPTQLTHGDCNVGNVLVHNGEVTGYIDLDHLPHSPRVRDLSYYLHSRLVDPHHPRRPKCHGSSTAPLRRRLPHHPPVDHTRTGCRRTVAPHGSGRRRRLVPTRPGARSRRLPTQSAGHRMGYAALRPAGQRSRTLTNATTAAALSFSAPGTADSAWPTHPLGRHQLQPVLGDRNVGIKCHPARMDVGCLAVWTGEELGVSGDLEQVPIGPEHSISIAYPPSIALPAPSTDKMAGRVAE